jgi:hypothetical protein
MIDMRKKGPKGIQLTVRLPQDTFAKINEISSHKLNLSRNYILILLLQIGLTIFERYTKMLRTRGEKVVAPDVALIKLYNLLVKESPNAKAEEKRSP